MTVAPAPIKAAHLNPRRAPSFRMVRLTGPTGMHSNTPLMKPVNPARTMGGRSNMRSGRSDRLLVVFLLDFAAPRARDAWSDEAVGEVSRKKGRQHVVKHLLAQDQQTAHKQ